MNNLIKKFLSFSIGGYIALAIGFFTTPIVTRMLSPEQYGIFSMVTTIANMLLLVCGLGFDQGFVRYFYEEKKEYKGQLLFNSIKYPFILTGIMAIIIYFFRKKISIFLFNEYNANMVLTFIIIMVLTLINRYSILVIRMNQKAKLFSLFQILNQVLNFLFIIILFKKYGNNYKTLVIASVSTLFIVTSISIINEKEIWKFKGKYSTINMKQLITYSLPLSITMALSWIFSSSDKIMIKYFSNFIELGIYAGAFKIISLLNILQTGFTTFWVPVAYEKYENHKDEKVFFENVFKYISFLMSIVAICILVSRDLLIMILGPKYSLAVNIMPMLVLMPIMYTVSETTVLGINFKKKSKYHLYISISVALFNILGNFLLVPKLGAKGAAISTGLAYILFFILRTYFSIKFIKFNFELKKFYFIIFLITIFAIYLSFYNNLILSLIIGSILMGIIILLNINMLKEVLLRFK